MYKIYITAIQRYDYQYLLIQAYVTFSSFFVLIMNFTEVGFDDESRYCK